MAEFSLEMIPDDNLFLRVGNFLSNIQKKLRSLKANRKFLSFVVPLVSLVAVTGAALAAKHFFSRAQTVTADINITVDLSKKIGVDNMATGATHTQYSADSWNDATAVASAKQLLQNSTVFQNQHIMGWGADDPEPTPGNFNWGSLDARVQLMRGTGATMMLTFCCSPGWMRPSGYQDDWSHLETAPDPSHVADFANLAKAVAQRYPDVKYFQVWNELKGMWGDSPGCTPSVCGQNRWDYERYTTLYNAVYDAVKSVRPDALIGGPYVVADSWSSSSQSNPSNVSGPYGVLDQRPLDVITYWLANKHGADFITIDGGPGPKDNTWVTDEFTAGQYFMDVYNWVRSLDQTKYPGAKTLPLFWAEWYASMPQKGLDINHDTAVMASDLIYTAKSGANLPLVWEPQGDTNGFSYPVGIWTDTRVAGGGKATPFYAVQKAFKDNFPPGTVLYNATSSSTEAAVLASASKALIVNRSGNSHYVSVNGQQPVALGPYQVTVVSLQSTTSSSSSPIALRSLSTSTNSSKVFFLRINKPAGVVAGDVMVAQLTIGRANIAINPPSGWNLIRTDITSRTLTGALYYRVATASEPSYYTWQYSSRQMASGGIIDYAGVDNSSPIDAAAGQPNANTSQITAPSVATTASADQLLFFGSVDTKANITAPSGMAQQWSVTTNSTTSFVADQALTTSGATGNKIATQNTNNQSIGQLVALRPAFGSAPTPTPAQTPTPSPVSTTPTPTPTPAPTATPPQSPLPYGQSGNWKMIFDDEFNGTSVDLTKWRPNWLGGSDTAITPPIETTNEKECYDPAQVSVGGGALNLTAVSRSCLGYNFASGMVESNSKFNFTYGYMEARIWTPAGTGVWPAFWSDGQNWPYDGEIDVLEAYGTDLSTYHYHYAGCGGNCGPGGETTVPGATTGFHIYAADWEPGVITWYYDGVQVWQYTTGITTSPQYLIANLGLNSTTPTVPSTMKVDYIRVWQKAP